MLKIHKMSMAFFLGKRFKGIINNYLLCLILELKYFLVYV